MDLLKATFLVAIVLAVVAYIFHLRMITFPFILCVLGSVKFTVNSLPRTDARVSRLRSYPWP